MNGLSYPKNARTVVVASLMVFAMETRDV